MSSRPWGLPRSLLPEGGVTEQIWMPRLSERGLDTRAHTVLPAAHLWEAGLPLPSASSGGFPEEPAMTVLPGR